MAYIGSKPADKVLTASDITDGIVSTAKIADNAVTADKTSYKDVPFRNILINGDMSQAQRATTASSITAGGYHTVDRWYNHFDSCGTWTLSQDTDVPTGQGFATSLKMDNTTADASPAVGDVVRIWQKLEGQNLQHLKKGTANAEDLTCSFWVKSTKTGSFICNLYDEDNGRINSQSYTVSSSDTWEEKSVTFAGDTTGAFGNDNGSSLWLIFFVAAGTNWTSGTLATSWQSTTVANMAVGQVNCADSDSNNFWITGIQLEVGTSASDFEFLPVDVNLQRCQRYYQVPNQGYRMDNHIANCYSSTTAYGQIHLIVPMRTVPSVTWNAVGSGDIQGFADDGERTITSISSSQLGQYTVGYNVAGTFTAGSAIHFNNYDTTNPFVKVSAEL